MASIPVTHMNNASFENTRRINIDVIANTARSVEARLETPRRGRHGRCEGTCWIYPLSPGAAGATAPSGCFENLTVGIANRVPGSGMAESVGANWQPHQVIRRTTPWVRNSGTQSTAEKKRFPVGGRSFANTTSSSHSEQAFRKVFRPNDEGPDVVDPGRFAGETVRQHQFVRIAKSRGWRIQPLGVGDDDDGPVLILPYWNLRASLDVRGEYENHHDLTAIRQFIDVKLGPLQFVDDNGAAKPLDDVPKVVYSEVMRHISMFVAVSRSHDDDDDEEAGPCQVYPFEPSP